MKLRIRQPERGVVGAVGGWASGKTYWLCEQALTHLERSDRVIVGHNFGFTEAAHSVELVDLDDLIAFACYEAPHGWRKLMLIDEIGAILRSGSGSAYRLPAAFDVVFQQGRKLHLDFLWTTQDWRFVNVDVRRITTKVISCRGDWIKEIGTDDWGEIMERPRIFIRDHYKAPSPTWEDLPKKSDYRTRHLFRDQIAGSYDTMKLVRNAQQLLAEQWEAMKAHPLTTELDYLLGRADSPIQAIAPLQASEVA